jgi:hypothetical protein
VLPLVVLAYRSSSRFGFFFSSFFLLFLLPSPSPSSSVVVLTLLWFQNFAGGGSGGFSIFALFFAPGFGALVNVTLLILSITAQTAAIKSYDSVASALGSVETFKEKYLLPCSTTGGSSPVVGYSSSPEPLLDLCFCSSDALPNGICQQTTCGMNVQSTCSALLSSNCLCDESFYQYSCDCNYLPAFGQCNTTFILSRTPNPQVQNSFDSCTAHYQRSLKVLWVYLGLKILITVVNFLTFCCLMYQGCSSGGDGYSRLESDGAGKILFIYRIIFEYLPSVACAIMLIIVASWKSDGLVCTNAIAANQASGIVVSAALPGCLINQDFVALEASILDRFSNFFIVAGALTGSTLFQQLMRWHRS